MAELRSVPRIITLKHPIIGRDISYPYSFEQKHLDSAARYEATSSDIFVCAFAKCGTTWVQNIVWTIVHQGEPINKYLRQCIPMLEYDGCEAVEAIDNSKCPRIIKTHLPYPETPHNKDAKYVYVTRNPKDVLVSYLYHTKGLEFSYNCPDVTIEILYELYIKDKIAFNGYFANVNSWCEQRHQPNILFLLYEDLKRDLRGNVLKIARFLGEQYEKDLKADNEKILKKVLEECSFQADERKQ